MPTFSNIGLAEPSTITKVVASVIISRGSTAEHQEILCLGDPTSSGSIAQVSSGTVTSSFAGLVTKIAAVAADAGRLNIGSTAADNAVLISGNSTVIQGTNPWVVGGNSSVRANLSSTAADNPVSISGNSTVAPLAGSLWTIAFQAGNLSSVALTAASSGLAVRPVWSSSNADQPVSAIIASGNSSVTITTIAAGAGRVNIGSSAADNAVLATIGTNIQSTSAPSSNSSGIITRQVIDVITSFGSTSALASTSLSCVSSAGSIRAYVTAFSITSTNQTPAQWGFWSSNANLLWPMTLAALSSGVAGMTMAVSAPAYLFRTNAGEALNFKTQGSTVSVVQLGVSYFQAP